MKNKLKLIGIIALAAVIGFGMIACGEGPSSTTTTTQGFSVQGKFTGHNSNEVLFTLTEESGSASWRAAATQKNLKGLLDDGEITFRLKGTYDVTTGNYSASAASSVIRYTINGVIENGSPTDSTATVLVKTGEEWTPHYISITAATREEINNMDTSTPQESISGLPDTLRGVWKYYDEDSEYSEYYQETITWSTDITATVNQWDVDFLAIYKLHGNTQTESIKATIVEFNPSGNTYDVVFAYPIYKANKAQAQAAVNNFFSSRYTVGYVTGWPEMDNPGSINWPESNGLYYYVDESDPEDVSVGFIGVGISQNTWKLVDQFYYSSAMEKYLKNHDVNPTTVYAKARIVSGSSSLTWTIFYGEFKPYSEDITVARSFDVESEEIIELTRS